MQPRIVRNIHAKSPLKQKQTLFELSLLLYVTSRDIFAVLLSTWQLLLY